MPTRAGRSDRRLSAVLVAATVAAALAAVSAAWFALRDDDGGPTEAATGGATSTTVATTSEDPGSNGTSPDLESIPPAARETAESFVDAWFRDDREAALRIGATPLVDRAFAMERGPDRPAPDECYNVGTDQFDCNFSTSEGVLLVRVELLDGNYRVTEFGFP